jgi:hypothetical protein
MLRYKNAARLRDMASVWCHENETHKCKLITFTEARHETLGRVVNVEAAAVYAGQ